MLITRYRYFAIIAAFSFLSYAQCATNEKNTHDIPAKVTVDNSFLFGFFQSAAFQEGVCGAIAGIFQVILLMWLRTTASYQYRYGGTFRHAMYDLYKQGGIMRFYRGVSFAMVQNPLVRFSSVVANDITTHYLTSPSLIVFQTAVGSVLAGLLRMFLMPIDTCKTVLQVDGSIGFEHLMTKVVHLLRHYSNYGNHNDIPLSMVSLVFHRVFVSVCRFLVHNLLDRLIAQPSDAFLKVGRNAFIGLIAAIAAEACSNALRVVKTVRQTSHGKKKLVYIDIIREILSEHGWRGLFTRGLSTRILLNAVQSIIFIITWKSLSSRHSES